MINPTGLVYVAGTVISGALSGTAPVALSTSFDWGRRSLFDQPDVATGQVAIFDPSGTWGTGIEARGAALDLIGEPLDLGWRDAGVDHINFRGRITAVTIAPFDHAGYRGALITLTVTSRLAELGYVKNAAFPTEAAVTRLGRIQTAAAALAGGAVASVSGPAAGPPQTAPSGNSMRARVAGDVDLLTALQDAYKNFAASTILISMTYDPATRAVRGLRRRKFGTLPASQGTTRRGLAGLRTSTERVGAYIAPHVFAADKAVPASPVPLYLDGGATTAPAGGWLARSPEGRVTQVDTTWWAVPAGGGTSVQSTYSYTVPRTRTGLSAQVARVDTEIEDSGTAGSTAAQNLGKEVADLALYEGGGWILEPPTLDTAVSGGFENLDQVTALLAGTESEALMFLQSTRLPEMGVRPLFSIIGGTITCAAGHWTVAIQLAPVMTTDKQHAVTWAEIDDGTTGNTIKHYLDGADHADGLHSSVTVEDLAYCATGLGVTTPGPDTGWDTLQ